MQAIKSWFRALPKYIWIFIPLLLLIPRDSTADLLEPIEHVASDPEQDVTAFNTNLVYSTSFEDAEKISDNNLNISIPHWFEFDGVGGAEMFVDEEFAHSGSKSIGLSWFDHDKSHRAEFDLMDMDEVVGDELSISVWLYFPEDYNQNVPGIDWNWHEFFVIYSHDNPGAPRPYLRLIVSQPDITKKEFKLSLGGRAEYINGSDGYLYAEENNFPFPIGEWFNLHYYLYRHPTDGIVKIWFDGDLVFNEQFVRTKEEEDYGYKITIGKLYFEPSEPNAQHLWVDDLQVYKGYVTPKDIQ